MAISRIILIMSLSEESQDTHSKTLPQKQDKKKGKLSLFLILRSKVTRKRNTGGAKGNGHIQSVHCMSWA